MPSIVKNRLDSSTGASVILTMRVPVFAITLGNITGIADIELIIDTAIRNPIPLKINIR
jgi:hypothetical protein